MFGLYLDVKLQTSYCTERHATWSTVKKTNSMFYQINNQRIEFNLF